MIDIAHNKFPFLAAVVCEMGRRSISLALEICNENPVRSRVERQVNAEVRRVCKFICVHSAIICGSFPDFMHFRNTRWETERL